MSAGRWTHSACIECYRKRIGRFYTGHQIPNPRLRRWEVCCFCGRRHKSGIHIKRNPKNKELICAVLPAPVR
jgi:hypothetical protein